MAQRITRGRAMLGALTLGGVRVSAYKSIVVPILAASVDQWAFIADSPIKVTGIVCDYSVAGGAGAAVKVRKVTADTVAPGAAAGATVKELQSAAFDLTATANTKQTATLVAVDADLTLATGDKLGIDFAGTLTGLAGGIVQIRYKPV